MFLRAILALTIPFSSLLAVDKDAAPNEKEIAAVQKVMKAVGELEYQSGEITLIGGKAKIKLGDDFRFLDAKNARKVLVDIWHNPPDTDPTDGMIVPNGVNFLSDDAWVALLTWKDDGYVKDDDFASIDFNDMLKEMKEAYHEGSKQRVAQGYGKMELVNWAKQPHYDKATHKLYYAKSFDVDGEVQQLNYDIRILGRHGHFEVSIMSSVPKLAEIETQAPAILGMVDFTEGNRYADYKSGDKVAAYGIAGLIAGGVLAKTGLLKGLLLLLLKGWKLVAIAVVAIGVIIKKIVSGRQQKRSGYGVE